MPAIIDRAPSRDGPTETDIPSVQRQIWQLVYAQPDDQIELIAALTQVLSEDDVIMRLWLTPGQRRLVAVWLPAPWRQVAVCALRHGRTLSKPEIRMIDVLGLDQAGFIPPPDAPPEP